MDRLAMISTLVFGVLALVLLLIAALAMNEPAAVLCALLATGAAYASEWCSALGLQIDSLAAERRCFVLAMVFNLASAALWIAGVVHLS